MCCCINSVNAGKAPRYHRRVHGKHPGMSVDSGYSGSQGLLTLLSACAEPSLSLTKLSSEKVEEETKHQGSKVSNARPFTHKSLVPTHQDVTCASFSPTMQAPSGPAGEGSGPPREPDSAAVKGECKVNSGG